MADAVSAAQHDTQFHRIHGAGIYANIGGILMVNVTIYTIHGSYGNEEIHPAKLHDSNHTTWEYVGFTVFFFFLNKRACF